MWCQTLEEEEVESFFFPANDSEIEFFLPAPRERKEREREREKEKKKLHHILPPFTVPLEKKSAHHLLAHIKKWRNVLLSVVVV